MKPILLPLLFALLCLALNACQPKGGETTPETIDGTEFRRDAVLHISAPDGTRKASFEVEIAATPQAITQGLMYRESLAANRGMLFDPQGLADTGFWMKNTYIPLDIIFIDENSRVMNIARATKPFSTEHIPPEGIYRYVLEVNAGIADTYNFSIGDKIEWTTESPEP